MSIAPPKMPQSQSHLIQIAHLSKAYCTKKTGSLVALSDINLSIEQGEFIALVGASGCGKTTLLKILAGLVEADSGQVLLNGSPVNQPSAEVGFVFQDSTLLPWRTVLANILLPVELTKLDISAYRQRALELMDMVGLTGFENKYPDELSGGMRQRAGICRALIRDPKVLLMDEPFGSLDAMTREYLNLELQRIWMNSGKTIIFVTHSISEAVFLASRVVIMSARPSEVAEIVPINNMPRPRRLEDLNNTIAGHFIAHIRKHFNASSTIS